MRVRFSSCRGQTVREDSTEEDLGILQDLLIDPDSGKIEGFFVRPAPHIPSRHTFLPAADILKWGRYIRVRSEDVLVPVEEIIRLEPLLTSKRTVMGQPMRTQGGTFLGTCRDVQFDTSLFHIEWFFPRRFFHYKPAISAANILEVRDDVILVQDQDLPIEAPVAEEGLYPVTTTPAA